MYHPFSCYLGVTLTFALTFTLFEYSSLDAEKFFYVPILLLITFYTLVSMLGDKQKYRKRSFKQAIVKGIGRYIYWGLILTSVIWFYRLHPAYNEVTPNTQVFLEHFFYAFAVLGLPYFYLEEKYRYCQDNVMADPYLKMRLLMRCLLRKDFQRFRRRLFSRRSRGVLLAWILRVHYLPIMVEQVYYGITVLTKSSEPWGYSLASVVVMVTALAWLIDSNNASIGYFWHSAFTKTRFRQIDPHPSHWIIVLACYPPFIYLVNKYFAVFPYLPEDSQSIINNAGVNTAIDLILLASLVLYMLSGCTLAFSYSNLCYKKIQTKGPYRLIRHPATAFKMIFFTLGFYRFAPAYTALWFAFYVFWMSVYIGRALVEERFLRRFPDYREYMKKTRYRFVPGII